MLRIAILIVTLNYMLMSASLTEEESKLIEFLKGRFLVYPFHNSIEDREIYIDIDIFLDNGYNLSQIEAIKLNYTLFRDLIFIDDTSEKEYLEYILQQAKENSELPLTFPKEIEILENLKTVSLDNSQLSLGLGNKIDGLENFQELNIKELYIENFDARDPLESIYNIGSLEVLTLKNCSIEEISERVENLTNLKRLDLSSNPIKYISENLKILENLNYLSIRDSDLVNIPLAILSPYITELNLEDNSIEEIPTQIIELINLEKLNLSGNSIKKVSENFKKLENLKYVSLEENNLTFVPLELLSPYLTSINLSSNLIEEFPNTQLTTLTTLELRDNRLKDIPNYFLDRNNSNEIIDLSFNQIESIPPKIFQNFFNGQLYLQNNYISYLPYQVCNSHLYNLDFSYNLFEEIPTCFKDVDLYPFLSMALQNGKQPLNYYDLKIDYKYSDDKESILFYPIVGDDFKIKSYRWSFGDGESSNEENTTHKYLNYGVYNISLTLEMEDENISVEKSIYFDSREVDIDSNQWYLLSNLTKEDLKTSTLPKNSVLWIYRNSEWIREPAEIKPTEGFWIKSRDKFKLNYGSLIYSTPNYLIESEWKLLGNGSLENYKNYQTYIYLNGEWILNPEVIEPTNGFWIRER